MMTAFKRGKTVLCLLAVVILLIASVSGCDANETISRIQEKVAAILGRDTVDEDTPEKTVSYSELDSEGQTVVDLVYDIYDSWDSVYDSGKDIYCTNIGFFSVDGDLVFAMYYSARSAENGQMSGASAVSTFGFYGAVVVNRAEGKLEGYNGSSNNFLNLSFTEQVWDADADADTQKDIIANEYAAFLESEED